MYRYDRSPDSSERSAESTEIGYPRLSLKNRERCENNSLNFLRLASCILPSVSMSIENSIKYDELFSVSVDAQPSSSIQEVVSGAH